MAKQSTYRTAQDFPTELMQVFMLLNTKPLLNANPLALASACYNKNCGK